MLAGLALVAGGASAVPAAAAPAGADPRPIARGLLSPLSIDQAGRTVWGSENFAGELWRKRPRDRVPTTVYTARPGTEVGAVSVRGRTVTFAVTTAQGRGRVMRRGPGGRVRVLARLSPYERRVNPDGATAYGLPGLSEECAAQWPVDQFGPPTYTGIQETHPYATERVGGRTYVADAAMNAVLAVGRGGRIRTVAVLPPVPVELTAERVATLGLPECVTGEEYLFEPVPTDVEVAPDGQLLVSSLPGGPEDPSLGANGGVFRVDPATGTATRVVGGLVSAVSVAVDRRGTIYISELFANRVSRVLPGATEATRWRGVRLPGDVETTRRGVLVTANVLSGLSGAPGDRPAGRVRLLRR